MKKYLFTASILSLAMYSQAQFSAYRPGLGYEDHKDYIGLNHTDGTIRLGTFTSSGSAFIQTHSDHPLYFGTNNSPDPKVVLASLGYLGINLADGVMPVEKLEIKNGGIALWGWENPAKPTGIEFTNNTGTASSCFLGMEDDQSLGFKSYTTGLNEIIIKNSLGGNPLLGLGTTNPQSTLDVNGIIRLTALAGTNRALVMVKTDNTFRRYNSPLSVSVSASDYTFSSEGMLNDSNLGYIATTEEGRWSPYGNYHFIEKALQLPQGSTIKNFTAKFVDNNSSGKLRACLRITSVTATVTSHCINTQIDYFAIQTQSLPADIAVVVNNDLNTYSLRVESVTNDAFTPGPWNEYMGIRGVKIILSY